LKNCLIDPRRLLRFDFGSHHPFKIYRLGLTYALLEAYGLTGGPKIYTLEPREATLDEAKTFHSEGYLEILRLADTGMWVPNLFSHGLGTGDNPVFPGVYDWGMSVAGASIQCAQEILAGRTKTAFNFSGGLHHAMPSRASGFCHINDVVLAIKTFLARKKRVVYIDIDAHHGDGVQYAFYRTSRVLTISIHQSGRTIFPGTGFVQEIGEADGEGYTVNVPLLPGARDDVYDRVLHTVVLPLVKAYAPDVLVTQLGVDALWGDLVAGLEMSLRQFERFVVQFRAFDKPWLALGGGGYAVENVVRAWTMAWAVMNDVVLPDEIPEAWLTEAAPYGVAVASLRGKEVDAVSSVRVSEDLDRTIHALRNTVFPRVLH
jgi:acetoin utilization protein AcuC